MGRSDGARSKRARCPFYRRDSAVTISCEGLCEGSVITQSFAQKADCAVQFDTFCAGAWRNCEIRYAICLAKYGDEIEGRQ